MCVFNGMHGAGGSGGEPHERYEHETRLEGRWEQEIVERVRNPEGERAGLGMSRKSGFLLLYALKGTKPRKES